MSPIGLYESGEEGSLEGFGIGGQLPASIDWDICSEAE